MIRVDSDKDKKGLCPLMTTSEENCTKPDQVAPSPSPSDRKHFDYYHSSSAPNTNTTNLCTAGSSGDKPKDEEIDKNESFKLKRVRFERRISGQFGDEALGM
jgi:hypothetical protein